MAALHGYCLSDYQGTRAPALQGVGGCPAQLATTPKGPLSGGPDLINSTVNEQFWWFECLMCVTSTHKTFHLVDCVCGVVGPDETVQLGRLIASHGVIINVKASAC